jgi:hypothetical protein
VKTGQDGALPAVLVEKSVGPLRPEWEVVAEQRKQHRLLEGQMNLHRRMDVPDRGGDRIVGGGLTVESRLRDGAGPVQETPDALVLGEDATAGGSGVDRTFGGGPTKLDHGGVLLAWFNVACCATAVPIPARGAGSGMRFGGAR